MDDERELPAGFATGLKQDHADALATRLRGLDGAHVSAPPRDRLPALELQPYKSKGVSFGFTAFGVRIGVSLENAELLDAILDRLPISWEPVGMSDLKQHYFVDRTENQGDREWYRLTSASGDDYGISGPDYLPESFESQLEDFVALNATPWLFLHAGVVGWHGRAIVLPGESFAGKSTLTAALVAAGARYYSDEFAVLDASGRVYPYPRRLSLRAGGFESWQFQRLKVADALMPRLVPQPIALVALFSYDPNRPFHIERLDPGAAIMALCEHSVAIRRRPADTLSVLRDIVNSATVLRGYRGEADEAASWLLAMVENELNENRKPG